MRCVITVPDGADAEKVFRAEDKEFKHGRSSYAVEQKGKDLLITIDAKDPTALRATVTSVTRILNIVQQV
jgi:tRNA threonylcarbamoyladenosine modification (KEOPS) complex  Pcc1 subunit